MYAFGVVIYEMISAKEAIVKQNGNAADSRGLVALVSSPTFLAIVNAEMFGHSWLVLDLAIYALLLCSLKTFSVSLTRLKT